MFKHELFWFCINRFLLNTISTPIFWAIALKVFFLPFCLLLLASHPSLLLRVGNSLDFYTQSFLLMLFSLSLPLLSFLSPSLLTPPHLSQQSQL